MFPDIAVEVRAWKGAEVVGGCLVIVFYSIISFNEFNTYIYLFFGVLCVTVVLYRLNFKHINLRLH